ncbi:hypothetical protein TL16_g10253 [Triparma laevis f. inornata]|uniref:Histone deacetylase domain-containing protein n=1 Tax=Triparma laevis f. inornata TaxID=1714386 RepID=A0A9W7BD63_9STRA|nr:hypothetical protein TL16_g10253 [Triparma laevis f. inornata]
MSFATHTPKPSASENANGQLKGARFASSSLDKTTRKILGRTHLPENHAYECPERVKVIYSHLKSRPNFDSSYIEFSSDQIQPGGGRLLRPHDLEILHSPTYIKTLTEFKSLRSEQLRIAELKYDNDVYVHSTSFEASLISASGVLDCCRRATHSEGGSRMGMAICRPPGHHACQNKAMGFCFLNNVGKSDGVTRKSERGCAAPKF